MVGSADQRGRLALRAARFCVPGTAANTKARREGGGSGALDACLQAVFVVCAGLRSARKPAARAGVPGH